MSDLIPALGGSLTTKQGETVSSGLARTTKRELDTIHAQTEIVIARENAQAFHTATAMTAITTLVGMAEQMIKQSPAAASYIEPVLAAYSMGAARRVGGF